VDFYIITDNEQRIINKPDNVKIISRSLPAIRESASAKLGFTANLHYPYKFCDFKPTYGLLFQELIEGYDFWGHGDVDMIYGDIRSFMTEQLLRSHDIVNNRHDYISGAFCLFRNTNELNTLFMQSKDYKTVLTSSDHFSFCECSRLWNELANGHSLSEYSDRPESMTHVVRRLATEGKLRAYFDFIGLEGTPGEIMWRKGKITYQEKYEGMFYHLVRFKNECENQKPLDPIPEKYFFTPNNIVLKN